MKRLEHTQVTIDERLYSDEDGTLKVLDVPFFGGAQDTRALVLLQRPYQEGLQYDVGVEPAANAIAQWIAKEMPPDLIRALVRQINQRVDEEGYPREHPTPA